MHADEANQAVKLGDLLDTGVYAFDPKDHHGPTLYYLALPIAWLKGETSLPALTESTVRLLPALAGTVSVLLLAALATALASPRGNPTQPRLPGAPDAQPASVTVDADSLRPGVATTAFVTIAAAAFFAVSPPAVYYSRYFIQETLLVTFTLAAFLCVQRWWRHGRLGWALAAGACIGLMFATKATAPLFLAAGALACISLRRPSSPSASRAVLPRPGEARPTSRQVGLAAGLGLLAALTVAALFYSSFGTHLAGLRDALRVYSFAAERAATGSGHEKPWWYYLRLFAWQREGGLVWDQLAFSALAVCGAGLACTRRLTSNLLRWSLTYTALIALALSVTPYKTPWHAIHLVPGLSLLAAGALGALPRWWISALLAVIVLSMQYTQTRLTVFLRAADPRNPYAYVHSSPDVLKFRALADAALARNPDAIVRVISGEYWPLPWYFRGLSRIGYWTSPPENCDGALVITSADLADTVRARQHGNYHESLLGLRPDYLCVVFTAVP